MNRKIIPRRLTEICRYMVRRNNFNSRFEQKIFQVFDSKVPSPAAPILL